jgi:hypothetical protein
MEHRTTGSTISAVDHLRRKRAGKGGIGHDKSDESSRVGSFVGGVKGVKVKMARDQDPWQDWEMESGDGT